MKKKNKFWPVAALLLAAMLMTLALTACDPAEGSNSQGLEDRPSANVPEGDYEFVFTGSGVFNDSKTYNFTILGNKDDGHTAELIIEELPALSLDATYTFVEGKGYKIYFDDSQSSFVYTAFDPATNDFTFKYSVNLGEGLGTTKVNFSYNNALFAAQYDGEGLGPVPPIFSGHGYGLVAGNADVNSTLTCFEDGTCNIVSESMTAVPTRYGTYTYDADANVYHFVFEEQVYDDSFAMEEGYLHIKGFEERAYEERNTALTEFETTYDDTTNTYSMTVEIIYYFFTDIQFTYIVE